MTKHLECAGTAKCVAQDGSSRHRVVVSGIGLWTSLGEGVETNWRRLLKGDSGIAPIRYWNCEQYATKVAACVRSPGSPVNDDPDAIRQGFLLFESVVGEAIRDSALDDGAVDLSKVGLAAGTSVNHLDWRQFRRMIDYLEADRPALDAQAYWRHGQADAGMFPQTQGELVNRHTARKYKLGGPSFVADTACAASAHAIGEAFRMVRRGETPAMIAGGAAALVRPTHILAFERLKALSTSADPARSSRPFDRDRDGFVMGEAAGAVVLESIESAQGRGARIYGELAGYGSSLSAHTLTDPSPDGGAEARAMALALEDAGTEPEEIAHVAAHGTSTPKGDLTETLAIRRVFGRHAGRLLVSSNKGQLGHTISAAGVCNLVTALKSIQTSWVAPTATLRSPDPQCDLDYVAREPRRSEIGAAVSNSFAFGGQNAALVVRRLAD